MKASTQEWLEYAEEDRQTFRVLQTHSNLTNAAAFHCQQCIEKSLKALAEEYLERIPRVHDLPTLYNLVKDRLNLEIDVELLEEISDVYTDVRYPADMGVLPKGDPTSEDIQRFANCADEILTLVKTVLKK